MEVSFEEVFNLTKPLLEDPQEDPEFKKYMVDILTDYEDRPEVIPILLKYGDTFYEDYPTLERIMSRLLEQKNNPEVKRFFFDFLANHEVKAENKSYETLSYLCVSYLSQYLDEPEVQKLFASLLDSPVSSLSYGVVEQLRSQNNLPPALQEKVTMVNARAQAEARAALAGILGFADKN